MSSSTKLENYQDGTEKLAAETVKSGSQQAVLHFLICPKSTVSSSALQILLSSTNQSELSSASCPVHTIAVPLNPPTSPSQAKEWSAQYWPTVYKGGNPYGPHPAILSRAATEIQDEAWKYMDLAMRTASAGLEQGIGCEIGAVVVDRSRSSGPAIISVAGDARWHGISKSEDGGNGNINAHAVMRVIGMVAKQRLALNGAHSSTTEDQKVELFADVPLTPVEKEVYAASTLAPGGYLCLNLELYLTHEPCVMCSMAILHSRFGRVVFGERMPLTGGLAVDTTHSRASYAEDDTKGENSGYGLWWRPELNWKLLAWQWVDGDSSRGRAVDEAVHA